MARLTFEETLFAVELFLAVLRIARLKRDKGLIVVDLFCFEDFTFARAGDYRLTAGGESSS